MIKSELLADLASKFDIVEEEHLESIDYPMVGWNNYLVKVWDRVELPVPIMQSRNLRFYVYHEGQGDEAAYYSPSDPRPAPINTFQADLEQYITDKINDDTIRLAKIENADIGRERAVGWVIIGTPGNFSRVNVVLFRQAGLITHEQYIG